MPRKTANLYLRNGIYWARLEVAGREYRATLRTTDAREAAHRLKGYRQKLERAALGSPDSPTWAEIVTKYWDEVLQGEAVKPGTAKRYMVSLRQLTDVFRPFRVDQITTAHIHEYISAKKAAHGTVTNATLRRDLTALSRLLSACVSWGYITENPVRVFDRSLIRERRDPIMPPSPGMLETVLAAAPPGIAAILRLLDQTGMRENEAVTLDAGDIDWSGRQLRLIRTKTNRPRTLDWQTPGGDAGIVLIEAPRHGPLFRSADGETYRNFASNFAQLRRRVARDEAAAGRPFRGFRVHDLRHGFAIRWLRNGGNIYELSLHLGHSSVKTTEGYLGYISARERGSAQTPAQRFPIGANE